MIGPDRRFWHWPGWARLGYTALLGLAVGLWFELIYGGANWITDQHTFRVRVQFDAELHTPFVPAAVVGYLSANMLFWMPAVILRTRQELRALAVTFSVVILAAGICFLLVPVELAFPPPNEMGIWTGPVRLAKAIARTNNLLPSLHVALSVVCVVVYARQASLVGKMLLWLWAGGIGVSTLLLHQHYLLDVVTGLILGLLGVRLVYDRWAGSCR
jgi:membrane-associated phospholipid phosphatase